MSQVVAGTTALSPGSGLPRRAPLLQQHTNNNTHTESSSATSFFSHHLPRCSGLCGSSVEAATLFSLRVVLRLCGDLQRDLHTSGPVHQYYSSTPSSRLSRESKRHTTSRTACNTAAVLLQPPGQFSLLFVVFVAFFMEGELPRCSTLSWYDDHLSRRL